jgi:hypothetical protein
MYTINETTYNKLKNLLNLIDSEESKDNYEDIDVDAVLEYTSELVSTIRTIIK